MRYRLGASSLWRLRGLHPDLRAVVQLAIKVTDLDFSVRQGLRTVEEQAKLVRSGASKTYDSRHLYGLAVDVAPYVAGRVRWDWPLYFRLMPAFHEAASRLGVVIRWGGVWDRKFTTLDPQDLHGEVERYRDRKIARSVAGGMRRERVRVFVDGPHLEIPKDVIPNPMIPGPWKGAL